MKNKFICYITISFLLFLQTKSFSQNIFDELKKATDQIQKDLGKTDSKPQTPAVSPPQAPAVSSSQKKTEDTKTSTPSKSAGTSSSSLGDFTLFGLKLGEPLSSVKLGDKSFAEKKMIGTPSWNAKLIPGAHITFVPETKNDYFDGYFISYSPISKKIEGIYGRSKQTYKNESECLKASGDNFKFVSQKNISNNKNSRVRNEVSHAYKLTEDIVFFFLPSGQRVYLFNYCNLSLNDHNWLILERDDSETGTLEKEIQQYNAQKGEKDFQKKKDTGKLKGL